MDYSEDSLVEQPAIRLFEQLGWESANCYEDTFGAQSITGRETNSEVVLASRLMPAMERLNPGLPNDVLNLAYEEISRDRSLMSMVKANHEIYELLKNGVRVTYRDDEGNETVETVRIIDWENWNNNDYFLASQLWISGEMHKKRPDLIGFVNGIPLIFMELKAPHIRLVDAFEYNFKDYKDTIPHLFWYTAVVILTNGSQTRVGSITTPWGHFNEWKKINSEGEVGVVSLETAIRGVCDPSRLLDLVENFTIFAESQGGLNKLLAKNHQYLGVNNAYAAVQRERAERDGAGRLGVFWHTQGSGKSYSMIFFAQKVLRKLAGNWTFVIITDRKDLDDQIYKNFASMGAVTEAEERVRAQSGEHLKQLLQEDHRYIFTLIHKFRTEKGEIYPVLSERDDIIILTDEAHRTQYDVLALNMRNALPNASFLAFTGTPLIATEERTKDVFGDYVSIYNFAQSVEDNATVPLYYENRIPELQLTNAHFNQDMEELLEEAELDEAQESKLEREFSREYHLITRNERLEKIAEDIVLHFMGRGFQGKAMMIAIDKATAIRMYDKVKKYWAFHLSILSAELETCDASERPEIESKIRYMKETDMAVVVSQGQNEISDMQEKGLDIKLHRKRMVDEDLDTKFKDPEDPLRIVFVCAMWITGFDVPSCSTIYLDKPMRNHTLMQTIARANRVWGEKVNGLIVDYIGIFRDLQKALAIYGTATGGGIGAGELPVETKEVLIEALSDAIQEVKDFLAPLDVNMDKLHESEGFERVKLLDDAVECILVDDETKREYLTMAGTVDRLFKAILPDQKANQFGIDRKTIVILAEKIRSLTPPADISDVLADVEDLLDESVAPTAYVIHEPVSGGNYLDLSKIDFKVLKRQFEKGHKRTQAEILRGKINGKLSRMIRLNKSRMDYYQRLQELIEEYNSGAKNIDAFYTELISLAQALNDEEKRGVAEQLSEEELALFDLLTRPNIKLSRKEKEDVKKISRDLLDTLKAECLVLDWRKRQQTRATVKVKIEEKLDSLPAIYNDNLFEEKLSIVYQHVYDSYYGSGKSIYFG